jgi:Lon protease-like protein
MQQVGDCGFFNWADNEMSSYKIRMVHQLKDDEQQSRAEVRRLEEKLDIMLQWLKDVEHQSRTETRRLEQKLDTEVEKKNVPV